MIRASAWCTVARTCACRWGATTFTVRPVRISFPPTTIGMSATSPPIRLSSAFKASRSGEPGAYDRIGSFRGLGRFHVPFIGGRSSLREAGVPCRNLTQRSGRLDRVAPERRAGGKDEAAPLENRPALGREDEFGEAPRGDGVRGTAGNGERVDDRLALHHQGIRRAGGLRDRHSSLRVAGRERRIAQV